MAISTKIGHYQVAEKVVKAIQRYLSQYYMVLQSTNYFTHNSIGNSLKGCLSVIFERICIETLSFKTNLFDNLSTALG